MVLQNIIIMLYHGVVMRCSYALLWQFHGDVTRPHDWYVTLVTTWLICYLGDHVIDMLPRWPRDWYVTSVITWLICYLGDHVIDMLPRWPRDWYVTSVTSVTSSIWALVSGTTYPQKGLPNPPIPPTTFCLELVAALIWLLRHDMTTYLVTACTELLSWGVLRILRVRD